MSAFFLLQSIGDGGQGWGNAILYILLAPRIRNRLCVHPCKKCCKESLLLNSLPTGFPGHVNQPTWNSTRRSLSYGIIGRSEPVSNSSVPDRSTASLIADMHEREILLAKEDSNRQQSSQFAYSWSVLVAFLCSKLVWYRFFFDWHQLFVPLCLLTLVFSIFLLKRKFYCLLCFRSLVLFSIFLLNLNFWTWLAVNMSLRVVFV